MSVLSQELLPPSVTSIYSLDPKAAVLKLVNTAETCSKDGCNYLLPRMGCHGFEKRGSRRWCVWMHEKANLRLSRIYYRTRMTGEVFNWEARKDKSILSIIVRQYLGSLLHL